MLIELAVLAAILLIVGNMVLPWIPVVIVLVCPEAVFVLGIALVLSVCNVYFRDVQHLIAIIAAGRSSTPRPIVYPISYVPDQATVAGVTIPVGDIYRLNPLVHVRGVVPRRAVRPPLPADRRHRLSRPVGGRARSPSGSGCSAGSTADWPKRSDVDVAVAVEDVWKRFRLYHERNQSLKAAFVRGRRARFTSSTRSRTSPSTFPRGPRSGSSARTGRARARC